MLALIFSVLSIAAPTLTGLLDDSGWKAHKKIRNKKVGTIVVQKKKIDGSWCYRAQSDVKEVSFTRLVEVSKDIPSAVKWSSSGVKESVVIEQKGSRIDYYQYLKIPFLRDRHWFLRGNIKEDATSFRFAWERVPLTEHSAFRKKIKEKSPKAITPPINVGEWYFQKKEAFVLVRYSICTDPGGSIPKSLRQFGTMKTLPTNVKEMVMEARKRDQ